MANAPDSALPPRERKKYVLDGEKVVFALHQHWLVVAEPFVSSVAVLVITIFMDTSMPGNARGVADAFWWIWFASILRALFCLWVWRHEWFIATNKRLMRVYGFIDRKVAMVPLGKVTDMRYDRTIPGRFLGYGTYVLESAGQVQALREVHFVPNPDANYRALVAEMFGVEDSGEVDEDLLDDGDGPETMDDLPVVQVDDRYDDRYRDLRAWHERHDDDRAWASERDPFAGAVHVSAGRYDDGRHDDRYDDRYDGEGYDSEDENRHPGYIDYSARQARFAGDDGTQDGPVRRR